jgi:hypothetical protein
MLQGAISMDIYKSIDDTINKLIISVENFEPSRLYIKRIRRTDGTYIYYVGKSCRDNVSLYVGSGKVWRDYIKKYGKDSIEQVWCSEWYTDPFSIQYDAIRFSLENDIINSSTWANSKIENGVDGGLISDDCKKQISITMTGIKRRPGSGTSGTIWINNGITRTCIKKDQDIPEGWSIGQGCDVKRLSGKNNSVYGKIKCNNGEIMKYFSTEDSIPDGWVKGGLKRSSLK